MRAFFVSELGLHRGYVSGKSTAMSTQSSSSAEVAQVDAKLGHRLTASYSDQSFTLNDLPSWPRGIVGLW
jgi:hypothetical protein